MILRFSGSPSAPFQVLLLLFRVFLFQVLLFQVLLFQSLLFQVLLFQVFLLFQVLLPLLFQVILLLFQVLPLLLFQSPRQTERCATPESVYKDPLRGLNLKMRVR
ncbi:hypothetical protein OYC64_009078 [Pagothenia borchgrevinki]|uniref:Transmembrane protein n=1 Tax=Pagothenia borchgrevinki TaxID=8213 RepID=A0ABD2G7Y3_PAGBO